MKYIGNQSIAEPVFHAKFGKSRGAEGLNPAA